MFAPSPRQPEIWVKNTAAGLEKQWVVWGPKHVMERADLSGLLGGVCGLVFVLCFFKFDLLLWFYIESRPYQHAALILPHLCGGGDVKWEPSRLSASNSAHLALIRAYAEINRTGVLFSRPQVETVADVVKATCGVGEVWVSHHFVKNWLVVWESWVLSTSHGEILDRTAFSGFIYENVFAKLLLVHHLYICDSKF